VRENELGTCIVRRIASLSPVTAAIRALFACRTSPLAATLYDPTATARDSMLYHAAVQRTLRGASMPPLRARVLFEDRLNDWQMKAVAAVMYAVLPEWDHARNIPSHRQGIAGERPVLSSTTVVQDVGFGVVNTIRSPVPEILVIEGPPGTGKTQTIATLTLNLLRALSPGSNRVLLCAPSNAAVDEALVRVRQLQQLLSQRHPDEDSRRAGAEPLRVGVRDSVAPEVLAMDPPVFLEDKVERSTATAKSSPVDLESRHTSCRQQLILTSPLVFSTLGSLSQLQRAGVRFDVVIVDEASQGTEPDTLQALLLARKKCVLVGDSNQLQPTILCNDAARCGLRRSLLVRLLRNGHASFLLRQQYRMHPDICAFPNSYLYRGKLLTDSSVRQRVAGGKVGISGPSHPRLAWNEQSVAQKLGEMPRLVFVNVEGRMERGRSHSHRNLAEAAALVRYMRELQTYLGLAPHTLGQHVGVITYYRAQRDTIARLLRRDEQSVPVATVDSFQGQEKEIILISCVRTYHGGDLTIDGELCDDTSEVSSPVPSSPASAQAEPHVRATRRLLGFLSDWHRINVSLTRAKELCVVFADRHTLATAAAWGRSQPPRSSPLSTADGPSKEQTLEELRRVDEDPFMLDALVEYVEAAARGEATTIPCSRSLPCAKNYREEEEVSDTDSDVQIVEGGEAATLPPARATYVNYGQQASLVTALQQQKLTP